MKRAFTMIGVLALLAAGCGSSSNNGNGGNGGGSGGGGGDGTAGMDMSAAAGSDLSMTLPPDMQPAYGCNALLACLSACTSFSCQQTCNASATKMARTLYLTLRSCVRNECAPKGDAGTGPCSGGGNPTPQCTMCEDDSLKPAGSCGADTTYCGTCNTPYMNCVANTP